MFAVVTLAALVAATVRRVGDAGEFIGFLSWVIGPIILVVTIVAAISWWQLGPRAAVLSTAFLLCDLLTLSVVINSTDGLSVIAGILGNMLLLVGTAAFVARLPVPWSSAILFASVTFWSLAALGIFARWHEARSAIVRFLADGLPGQPIKPESIDADMPLLWLSLLALCTVVGALVGWGMSVASNSD
jgi:hypothetical protein